MLFGLSNLIPISFELQLQYEQLRTHGPDCAACSAPSSELVLEFSRLVTERGAVQAGH
jgi:hypothetical protein